MMTPMWRGAKVGAAVVGALSAGAVGYWCGVRSVESTSLIAYLSSQHIECQSYLRYRFASPEVGARSMASYVEALELQAPELRRIMPNQFPRRLGMAYARRALLSERQGDALRRDNFFDKAQLQFATVEERVTRDELRAMVAADDARWDAAIRESYAASIASDVAGAASSQSPR